MRAVWALVVAVVLAAVPLAVAGSAAWLFAVAIPYAAAFVFVVGMIGRVVGWARSPVPFKIPTVCGQQRSLPWIRQQKLESPFTPWQVVRRMALEVLLFRSLFRNTRTDLTPAGRLVYQPDKLLWAGSLAFHWSLLVVLLRHLRFFLQPVPGLVHALETVDGLFEILVPTLLLTDVVILAAVLYLLGRRLLHPLVRYVSLPGDFFPLLLLLGIALTGVLLRYVDKVDLVAVKTLCLGLVTFHPAVPAGLSPLFFTHLFLVSCLAAYFPFSNLVHLGGIFLSPTRHLANANRARRHVNPWNHPVPVHTYAEWEEEFRDKLEAAGLPLEGGAS